MSKIYEALRRHEKNLVGDQPTQRHGAGETALDGAPANTDPPSRLDAPRGAEESRLISRTEVVTNFFEANREMQTLFRSVEPLIAGVQGGAIIMFSSAQPGEGKTSVCGSYAATLAQNFGKSVLILDADRDHVLTRKWGAERDANATVAELEKLSEEADVAALQAGKRIGARGSISVMPVDPRNVDGSALATIAANKDKFVKNFDYVLIDAPSVAEVSWGPSIGAMADGVILVVEAERTRWPVALNAKQEFEASGGRVLGVFLNKRRFYVPPRIYRRI
jgi:Mrp family chromosome partitioning ATPase